MIIDVSVFNILYSGVSCVRQGLRTLVFRMVNRKLFIALYREALQIELKKAHTAYFSGNSKILMTKGMGDKRENEIYDEMRELQGRLNAKEIFSYHDFVLKLLRKEGESVVALRKASQICSIKNDRYCSLSSSSSSSTFTSSSSPFHADMHPLPNTTTASTTTATTRSTTPTPSSTTTHRSSPVPIPSGTTKTISLSGTGAEKHKDLYGSDVESESLGSATIPLNNQQTLSISFTVQVARLAVTILEETAPSRFSNISRLYNTESMFEIDDARTTDNVRSVLSLVVYGTHVTVRTSGDDKELSGRIGSVRTYGLSGVEMLSCGSDPHYWMNQGVKALGSGQGSGGEKGEDRQDFAAELTVRRGSAGTPHSDGYSDSAGKGGTNIEHHDVASMASSSYIDIKNNDSSRSSSGSGSGSSERKEKDREREREKRKKNQTVIELAVYPLTATWDSQTLHLLRTLTDHLTRTLLNSSPLGHVTVLTAHEHALHRLKAASLSMLKTLGEVDYAHTR